ncbi:MAG: RNA-binding protein [Flavobacteriales bacterium]|nr:RNA-binding protein [Flavobacteriales bacterium]
MNIFVSRLSHAVTELHLELLFGHFGTVERATIIKDKVTGESRNFGFVEMEDRTAARTAIDKLNGAELEGSRMVVKPADRSARN